MSSLPSHHVFCNNCETRSPLNPSQTSDLSWSESLQNHISNYLLSAARWPIGYIIASPYSPLRVERSLPGRNCRDAFEDLLALETRGAMIDSEVRTREMKTAAAIRASQGAGRIRKLNQLYWRSVADIDMMKRISAISKEREQQELIEIGNQHIDREHRKILSRFAFTDNILASINYPAPITRVSSAYSKDRGHWMASLATSSACPGWTSVLTNSADGAWWHFAPVSDPRGEGNWDMGFSVTENELSDVFEAGKYFATRAPAPSPYDQNTVDASPQEKQDALQIAGRRTVDEIGQHDDRWRIPRPKATILRQSVFSKVTKKAGSDNEAIRVKITSTFTDGRAETKETVDDTSAVLREVERAVGDISDRNNGLDQESYEKTQEGGMLG